MAAEDPHDIFVDNFVAKFDGRSREIAEAQLSKATGDARDAWVAIIATLDARGERSTDAAPN